MTKAVRSYVFFVGLLSVGAAGLMAMKLAPAARRWRDFQLMQKEGTVIRFPGDSAWRGVHRQPENIAPFAEVTVSSEEAVNRESDPGVADGVVDSREWISGGQTRGAWILLNWDKPALVEEVDLFDRSNPADNVRSGTLSFDDGSTIAVGALPTDGTPLAVKFPPKTVGWVTFRIDSAEGTNAGLAEIKVRGTLNP